MQALKRIGATAHTASEASADDLPLRFQLSADTQTTTITGDGFAVQRQPAGDGVQIVARTQFGLMQAAIQIAKQLEGRANRIEIPLIASNPAVDMRAGGFGGSPFEVDFPYGSEAEWQAVLNDMIA